MGLNFGGTAFDGSNRWVQLEFRSPAGSGQYLTLNPRDKIMATPYAMFALNGGNGIWNYNAKAQTVSVLGQKVGIGTANPTAALEVVGTGGDDAVKLPAGSIGIGELSFPFSAAKQLNLTWQNGQANSINLPFSTPAAGVLIVQGVGESRNAGPKQVSVNGIQLGEAVGPIPEDPNQLWHFARVVPVTVGQHSLTLWIGGYAGAPPVVSCTGTFIITFVRDTLP